MTTEEVVEYEEEESPEEYADISAEDILPPADVKPKSDVWTLLMILCFVFLVTGTVFMVKELNEFYHVRFGMLSVPGQQLPEEQGGPAGPGAPPPADGGEMPVDGTGTGVPGADPTALPGS